MSITWNGVNSDTIGVIVERIPNRYVPTRRFSPQQVAGRNGNILLVDKAFPNVEQEYEVYLSAESQGLPSVARACAEWLMGPDGYCRLQDSYDTTVYREAFLMGGYDLENILNKFGRCTITFSCKPQKYLLTGDTPISIPAGTTTTYTGSSVQFDGITGASITSLSTTITPTQSGSGDPSPTNVRPISGLTGLSVYRAGKNLLPNLRNIGTNRVALGQTEEYSTLMINLAAGTYTLSITHTSTVNWRVYERHNNTNTVLGRLTPGGGTDSYTFTVDSDTNYSFSVYDTNGVDSDAIIQFWLEIGSTSTSYEPYSGNTYSLDWSTQAGTVYGGTLDVVTGVLTANRITYAFNGTESFSNYTSAIVCNKDMPVGYSVAGSDILCSHSTNAYIRFSNSGKSRVQFSKAYFGVTSADELKTLLANWNTAGTPLQYSYELATPLTYQLTAQEVEALVGTNNVWSSSGDVSVTVATPLGGTVTNPTPFEARPLLTVSGVGEITINGKSIQILESVSDFEIDCETMEAEDNSKIYCMDFPELSGGENEIVGYGSITALTVTPRWWTL